MTEVVQIPEPVLATPCTPLLAEDLKAGAYDALIIEMQKAMLDHNGIGLAANQIGKDLALFIIESQIAADNEVPAVFANPEITEYGKETDSVEEGCLSITGFWTPITRSKKIMFKALDGKGNKIKFKARGLLARVLQHETDHLNGLTIKDRSEKENRPA
jgi:peptide deformylase